MIKIEENNKSEAQLRLEEKLERDKKRLQEQIRKDHRKIEELKRKARGCIGDMLAEHLPDFYCFDGDELKEIIDTAMSQKAVRDKISEIRKRPDKADESEDNDSAAGASEKTDMMTGSYDGRDITSNTDSDEYRSDIEEDAESEKDESDEE